MGGVHRWCSRPWTEPERGTSRFLKRLVWRNAIGTACIGNAGRLEPILRDIFEPGLPRIRWIGATGKPRPILDLEISHG